MKNYLKYFLFASSFLLIFVIALYTYTPRVSTAAPSICSMSAGPNAAQFAPLPTNCSLPSQLYMTGAVSVDTSTGRPVPINPTNINNGYATKETADALASCLGGTAVATNVFTGREWDFYNPQGNLILGPYQADQPFWTLVFSNGVKLGAGSVAGIIRGYQGSTPPSLVNEICSAPTGGGTVNPGTTGPNVGTCGSANGKIYPSTRTGYSPDEMCFQSVVTTTAFPAPGATVNWTCLGASGVNASCSASRLSSTGTLDAGHSTVTTNPYHPTTSTTVAPPATSGDVSYCPAGLNRVWTSNGPICASIKKLPACPDNRNLTSTACHPELSNGLRVCDASKGNAPIYELTIDGATVLPSDDLVSQINLYKLLNACSTTDGGTPPANNAGTVTPNSNGAVVDPHTPPAENLLTNNAANNAANILPRGSLDEASCSTIRGWSYDPDSSDSSINVKVYDGNITSGRLLATLPTSTPLSDVNSANNITGNHGYSFLTPSLVKDRTNHFIYVYGIDSSDSTKNSLLSNSPTMINCTPPQPPMTGTLTPATSSCTIPVDRGNCEQTLAWSINNPEGIPTSITSIGRPNIDVTRTRTTPQSGTTNVTASYNSSGTTFYLYNNAQELARVIVNTVCATGTVWTPSSGTCRTIVPPITGTLTSSAPSCTLLAGQYSCKVSLSWNTDNPANGSVSAITSDSNNEGAWVNNFTVLSGNRGGPTEVTIPYSGRNFFLYNNAQLVAIKTVYACATGTSWNGRICILGATNTAPIDPPPPPTLSVSLRANVTYTSISNATTLTWTTNGNPTSCTSSNGTRNWSSEDPRNPTYRDPRGGSDTITPSLPAGTYTYTITCSKAGANATSTTTAVVNPPQ